MAIYGSLVPSDSTGPFAFRNRIINGAFQHWQRGTTFAYNTAGAYFNADRFWVYNNSGASSGNIERSTDVPTGQGFTYSLFNNTNGNHSCGTNIELTRQGSPAPFKVGQSYTLSMWTKGTSSSSSNLIVTWRNAHASGTNSVSIDSTKPIAFTTTWTRVTATFVITDNIDSNNLVLDLEWTLPAGGKITGVQLEEGPAATPFEHRPIGLELRLCQRYYYQKVFRVPVLPWVGTNNYSCGHMCEHPVTMRSSPSVGALVTASISTTLGSLPNGTTATQSAANITYESNTDSVVITNNQSGQVVFGATGQYSASSEL